MQKEQLKDGINYIVKVGRNHIAVRLIQENADGNYTVRNLRTGKPFFVNSENSFIDFQDEAARQKYERIIAEEIAPIVSKEPCESKISKRVQVMGHSKCAFVKALGKHGYKYYDAKKVLDACGITMPEGSIRIQIYFGKKSDLWKKYGKPAELTAEEIAKIDRIILGAE